MAGKPWLGRTVAVIASGPSLTKNDCDLIESAGLTTIAVNSSWKLARFADVLYAGDFAWWKACGHEVDIPAQRWSCARQAVHHFGAKLHNTYGGEYNSGQRAIQFAVERGAARVILLGFDGSLRHGVHWHGPHEKTGNPDEAKVKKWRRQFAMAASQAKQAGCEVMNCSRHTELTSFARVDLKDALRDAKDARTAVYLRGMNGLGDCIYQRAFLTNMPGAYVETPWPELYADLDVTPVRSTTKLRTQAKNASASKAKWGRAPSFAREVRVGYGHRDLASDSILTAMQMQFGVRPGVFDLPEFSSPLSRPFAIVRPVTERAEWRNAARNPKPEYVAQAARELRRRGFFVVSVADLESGKEWLIGDAPPADLVLHKGEWGIENLLGAIQHAEVVVGGVGWIVPACIAAKTPLYVIHGGHGGHNHKSRITAPWMDLTKIGWAEPDSMCMCTSMTHNCKKEIDGFSDKFSRWLDGQNLLRGSGNKPHLAA